LRVALVALLVVLAVPFVFPTWWMATSSLKPMSEVLRSVPTLWPHRSTLEAYGDVFQLQPFAQQYWNSLYIAVVVTVGTILVASMAGYAFARIRFPGANLLFLVVLVGMLVPSEVTIVPLFRMVNSLGLIDTHWPLVVVPIFGAPSVLATFIMRQFFLGVPDELIDAARVDGASEPRIFVQIVVPLAKPALATLAIITFLGSWNNFLWPLVVATTEEKYTLPVALALYSTGQNQTDFGLLLAGATVVVVPVLIVFLALQRYFVQGVAMTGIK